MSTKIKTARQASYHSVDNEAGDSDYEEEDLNLSQATKRWLIVGALAVSAAIIYLFCFLLPGMFVPEAIELVGISKVKDVPVELQPVSSKVVESWKIDQWDAVDTTVFEEQDDKEFDEDEQEVSSENTVLEPTSGKRPLKQRMILVGDIHGQYVQLRALLRKVGYNPKTDHLLVLGDFISKGPDSLKVLEFLIENNIDCILGNHEYYVLQNYATFHGLNGPEFVSSNDTAVAYLDNGVSALGFNEDPEFLLAKKLQPHHVEYINQCPVIKKLGKVPLHSPQNDGRHNYASGLAVHAGLRWDLTANLNDQDPLDCLQMRSYLAPFYNETTDDPREERAVSWSKVWNRKNKSGSTDHKYVAYYGHDARRSLNLKKWAKGLDHGCFGGDHLAAMVMWQEQTATGILYKEQVVRVKC